MRSKSGCHFMEEEMRLTRETDLPELLSHLGYQVRRIGRYHTTAEMDSLRIKDRRTWFRYSENTGGNAIDFLRRFCGKSFLEASICWPSTGGRGILPPGRCRKHERMSRQSLSPCRREIRMTAGSLPTSASGASRRG